jgi:anti-sigma B factor antagonist
MDLPMVPDPSRLETVDGVSVLSFVRDVQGLANQEAVHAFFSHGFQVRTAGLTRLVIDLTGVASLTSAALGPLVQKLRDMQTLRGRLALTGVDAPALKEIFALTRFDKVFAIHPNRATAVGAIRD